MWFEGWVGCYSGNSLRPARGVLFVRYLSFAVPRDDGISPGPRGIIHIFPGTTCKVIIRRAECVAVLQACGIEQPNGVQIITMIGRAWSQVLKCRRLNSSPHCSCIPESSNHWFCSFKSESRRFCAGLGITTRRSSDCECIFLFIHRGWRMFRFRHHIRILPSRPDSMGGGGELLYILVPDIVRFLILRLVDVL